MKAYSVHFILKGKSSYKDLAPVFPDMLKMFLTEIDQLPEEEEVLQMFIELNMIDIERDRKPEGYNRKGKARLVFPMDRKEFYVKTYNKSTDLSGIASQIKTLLDSAGVKYDMTENDNTSFD
ncbi:MAG: hypothetical protein IJ856_05125 [Candidatus Methanomethylophilaceae archaeon]|nr:hypothetical protein [Candidatus Methanomethylophilaceae archaeon]